MENMEDFCVSHNYTQRDLLLLHLVFTPPSSAATAITLKFHPKHVTNKNKTHIMKT
jgi:hypothetical protein